MNKKLKIIIISVVFILSIFFIFIKSSNTPEKVIKNYIKYKDMHNIDKLSSTVTYEMPDYYIDNIETMKLINLELITDEVLYNAYMHDGKGSLRKDLSRDDVRIYTVDYYIKYKDDNKSVEDSGEHNKHYTLIKEKGTNKWIIDSIGG
ncbi:DUF4829 domain-containing protein [Clostridium tertium]|uniref:DUF4829 domain-containing protein n=1 Tax=Clostridium tertium TaxID=1559 RepID=A0A6N3FST8_9CLOT